MKYAHYVKSLLVTRQEQSHFFSGCLDTDTRYVTRVPTGLKCVREGTRQQMGAVTGADMALDHVG